MDTTERDERIQELSDEVDEPTGIIQLWLEYVGDTVLDDPDSADQFRDAYQGIFLSKREVVYELIDSGAFEVPDHLVHYLDFDAICHDLDCDGWLFERVNDYKLAVFRPT